jgi:hypothetical protein
MAYVVGIALALAVVGFARWTRLDRDGAFYPTVVIVVAAYYVLFAAMGGSTHVLIVESGVMLAFVAVAVLGFKLSVWLVVAALAAHGVFDVLHPRLVDNAGVPQWWPAFCMTFDVGAAALLALLVARRSAERASPRENF